MGKIIRLTENELHKIVKQVINEAIEEINKRTALYPTKIYAASDNMIGKGVYTSQNNKKGNISINKVNIKSRKIADKAIMYYVIQEMKPHLSFRMKDATYPNRCVGLEFDIKEIKEFNETDMQLYGYIVTANWKGYVKTHGIIKCVFGENGKESEPSEFKFYWVRNIGSVVKTQSIELLSDGNNEKIIKGIISQIYSLRQEAENDAKSINDLSNFNLNGTIK